METIKQRYKTDYLKTKFNSKSIPEIDLIEFELYNLLSDSKGKIREMCIEILNAGGKRIRPLLVMYSSLVFSPVNKDMVKGAASAELIHMASLVHDDIIDNSDLRHNKPSVKSSWGNHFAVLCGDYLFSKAFGVLSKLNVSKCMGLMVKSIQNMCHGEILQANNKNNLDIDVDTYYEIIYKKTAVLIENCCKMGAAISGAGREYEEAMGRYGLHIGLAFQIIDDIMDIYGKVDKMGKSQFEDLRQGNITLPFIILLKNKDYSEVAKDMLRKRNDLEKTVMILRDLNIINTCFEIAAGHIKKAQSYLSFLPQSDYTKKLYSLSDILMIRAN
ncbi:polyprenyl synthetase family protein [Herbivorax sp. ANBcel31]|uniref:polyprenyl synthetase family protein n=1 Tax=Herbivorax sp. ANBcel31 TaxID=3069754 RepID=UPI0027B3D3AC|nr:polyprenyl synthetase family protein [Herbivorax sp. ANBcel31]MDQ2085326.1 polyprenyl synthetase family protein [Herbivorax sp. ANBcel31]